MDKELSKGFTGIEINGVRFANISEMLHYMDKQREHIAELEKENAALKAKNKWYSEQVCNKECAEVWGELTKAKTYLKYFIEILKKLGANKEPLVLEAEQFLNSEVEK